MASHITPHLVENAIAEATQPTGLPQELIDAILAHLHSEKEALRSTSLTARCFLPSSQAILFQEVEIKHIKQTRFLADVVSKSKHFPPLIRTFVIAEPTLKWMKKNFPSRRRLSTEEAQEVQRNLAQILDCLPNIEILHVNGGGSASHWPTLLLEFKDALRSKFASPTLKDVFLSGFFELPPSILHCFRPLRRLDLGTIAIYGDGNSRGQIETVRDYLNVSQVQIEMGILTGHDGTHDFFAKTAYILPTVINAVNSESVTELSLKYKWGVLKLSPTNFGTNLAQCTLNSFSNLTSLSFSWQILSPNGVRHFGTVIQTINPDAPLEHLVLDFGCVSEEFFETGGREHLSLEDVFEDLDWLDADDYLACLEHLVRFEVKIVLHQLEQFYEIHELRDPVLLKANTVEQISKVFPSMALLKKLKIEVIVEDADRLDSDSEDDSSYEGI